MSSVESFYRDHRRVAAIPPITTDTDNTANNNTSSSSSSSSSSGNAGTGDEVMQLQHHQEGQQQQHGAKSKHKHKGKGEGDADEIYQLFAVIMHRGSAHSGHYFAVSISTYILHICVHIIRSYLYFSFTLLLLYIILYYIVYKG